MPTRLRPDHGIGRHLRWCHTANTACWMDGDKRDRSGWIFWQTSNAGVPSPPADSPPNAAWINDPPVAGDKYLDVGTFFIFEAWWAQLPFRHNFNLQSGFDGGVLEISSFYINNGAFTDITDPAVGGSFETGGYNAVIATGTGSPIAGRHAWSGNSGGFITTIVNLPTLVIDGKLRWRMASDNTGSGEGWRIDNITLTECHFNGPPTPTPTATATATATATPTPTVTATASPTPTPTPPFCSVTSEVCGIVVTFPLTDYFVEASDVVNAATLDGSDFIVNGTPADDAVLISGGHLILFTFNTSPVIPGVNAMHIPAGAFNCFKGPVAEFTCTFTYVPNTPTPTPTATSTPTPSPRPTPVPRARPTPHPRP